jgi:hypothetical protein
MDKLTTKANHSSFSIPRKAEILQEPSFYWTANNREFVLLCIDVHIYLEKYQTCFVLYNVYLLVILLHVRLHYLTGNHC